MLIPQMYKLIYGLGIGGGMLGRLGPIPSPFLPPSFVPRIFGPGFFVEFAQLLLDSLLLLNCVDLYVKGSMMNDHNRSLTEENNSGTLVWAKLNKNTPLWPAIIVPARLCGFPQPKPDEECVFWYGDHRASVVPTKFITSFEEKIRKCAKEGSSKSWNSALLESLEDYAERKKVEHQFWTLKEALAWVKDGCKSPTPDKADAQTGDLEPSNFTGSLIPEYIKHNLEHIRLSYLKSIQKKKERKLSVDTKSVDNKVSQINGKKLLTLCLGCQETSTNNEHPIFQGAFCDNCMVEYKETFFYLGDDHKKHNCTICGGFGLLIVCSSSTCFCTYCKSCISKFFGSKKLSTWLKSDEWFCFLCEGRNNDTLLIKEDWKINLKYLYRKPEMEIIEYNNLIETRSHRKRPKKERIIHVDRKSVSVLSITKGEGSGSFSFDKMGFDVEKHFFCYVGKLTCPESTVPKDSFYLGNAKKLTEVNNLDKIDLVFGGAGSTSDVWYEENEDNSLNRFEELFFEFFRILQLVKTINPKCLYFFDCPASISRSWRTLYSQFLCHQPAVININEVSPHNSFRFHWGNLNLPTIVIENSVIPVKTNKKKKSELCL